MHERLEAPGFGSPDLIEHRLTGGLDRVQSVAQHSGETLVLAGVYHPNDQGPVDMLRWRMKACRDAIASTEAFLEKMELTRGA